MKIRKLHIGLYTRLAYITGFLAIALCITALFGCERKTRYLITAPDTVYVQTPADTVIICCPRCGRRDCRGGCRGLGEPDTGGGY